MRPARVHSTATNAFQRARQSPARLQQESEPASGYSPLLCIGLLLAIAMMVNMGG